MPYTSNAGQLKIIGVQTFSLGIGTALSGNLTIPAGATHVMSAPAGGENSQTLLLSIPVTGSAQAIAIPLGASGSGGASPVMSQPVPLPTGLAASPVVNLRRNVTTAAIDYNVFYLAPL